ncbi:family 16 glycosylhydrolase [Novipirellula caenicola]|uniref:GH16 domain-containing protein n=1 Tax=Novipirellula caenicola TaxID=1536901 RepID=A0ABP9W3V7_9BACT
MKINQPPFILLAVLSLLSSASMAQDAKVGSLPSSAAGSSEDVLPFSDPTNMGNWVLRKDISDEFEGDEIDSSKWFVEGAGGDYYIWKGRAPSQFAPHNVIVEDGKLKIRSQWEPDFDFAKDEGHEGNTYRTHKGKDVPVTTGAVVSRKRFLNGYMEVKSKAGDSAMTAAFWAIGYESELDVFEQMGRPNKDTNGDGVVDPGLDITADSTKMSVHDWQPPAKRPTRKFGYTKKLPFRTADDFHVYGCEWGEDYLKCFIDGELVYETTQAKEGKHWVLTNPLEIWLDSEIFVWLGLPTQDELPTDFEVEYMRVWQKPRTNLLDRAFFGFEGPFLFQDQPRPLDLVPESSENNDYQQFWKIDEQSAKHLSIVRHENFASGTRSLKFRTDGQLAADSVVATSPKGTVDLDAGNFELAVKVQVDAKSTAKTMRLSLIDSDVLLAEIDLSSLPRDQWVNVTRRFTLQQPASANDQLTISFDKSDVPAGPNLIYVDDVAVQRASKSR